jgi:hypothetical protein
VKAGIARRRSRRRSRASSSSRMGFIWTRVTSPASYVSA